MGLLKGLVVVSENPPDPETSEFVDMGLLRAPKSYCCRLYVVKGLHLQPKDINGLADPYLRCKVNPDYLCFRGVEAKGSELVGGGGTVFCCWNTFCVAESHPAHTSVQERAPEPPTTSDERSRAAQTNPSLMGAQGRLEHTRTTQQFLNVELEQPFRPNISTTCGLHHAVGHETLRGKRPFLLSRAARAGWEAADRRQQG